MEDSKGNMWFGTDGGAYIYDPKATLRTGELSLSNISEKDGLCNNSVNDILEDKSGNIWFATHHGGVCRWDGTSFTFATTAETVTGTEAWSLYEDRSGNIWFPIENAGVYRYDPSASLRKGSASLTNFHKKEGLMNGVHSIMEDRKGLIWFGGFGGLYRYDPSASLKKGATPFVNVTIYGPWTD